MFWRRKRLPRPLAFWLAFGLIFVSGSGPVSANCSSTPLNQYASVLKDQYNGIKEPKIDIYVQCVNLISALETQFVANLAVLSMPGEAQVIVQMLASQLASFLCSKAAGKMDLSAIVNAIKAANPGVDNNPSAPGYSSAPDPNRVNDILNRLKNLPGSSDKFNNSDTGTYSGAAGGTYDPFSSGSTGGGGSGGSGGSGWKPSP